MSAIATTSIHRVGQTSGGQLPSGPNVAVPAAAPRDVSADDVCDLIEAAGPLAISDIAGGLNRPLHDVSARVQHMVQRRLLQRDEFRRYRLCGACAMR